jgi:chromate transporter
MATFVGMKTGGLLGAVIATLGVVLPSFVIILIIAKCYQRFKSSKAVDSVMSGLKPAVVGMIGAALLSVGRTVFFPSGLQADRFTQASFWVFLGIFAVSAVLVFKKVNPIKIIVLSAAVGIGAGYSLNL